MDIIWWTSECVENCQDAPTTVRVFLGLRRYAGLSHGVFAASARLDFSLDRQLPQIPLLCKLTKVGTDAAPMQPFSLAQRAFAPPLKRRHLP